MTTAGYGNPNRIVPRRIRRIGAHGQRRLIGAVMRTVTPGNTGSLLYQELSLLLRGKAGWWYLGAAVILGLGITGGGDTHMLLAVAGIWPLFVWSGLGIRQHRSGMASIIGSSPAALRQFWAEWEAGAIVTAVFVGVAGRSRIASTGIDGVVVFASAVVFVPSVAIALGQWSHTPRLFEIGYLAVGYAGRLNGVPALDVIGATGETAGMMLPWYFAATGLLALFVAVFHRYLTVAYTRVPSWEFE